MAIQIDDVRERAKDSDLLATFLYGDPRKRSFQRLIVQIHVVNVRYCCLFVPRNPPLKHLTIVIRTELEIPETWELVEHPSGIRVLKIDDHFVSLDLVPFATLSSDPRAEWSDTNTVLVERVLDTVVESNADLAFNPRH